MRRQGLHEAQWALHPHPSCCSETFPSPFPTSEVGAAPRMLGTVTGYPLVRDRRVLSGYVVIDAADGTPFMPCVRCTVGCFSKKSAGFSLRVFITPLSLFLRPGTRPCWRPTLLQLAHSPVPCGAPQPPASPPAHPLGPRPSTVTSRRPCLSRLRASPWRRHCSLAAPATRLWAPGFAPCGCRHLPHGLWMSVLLLRGTPSTVLTATPSTFSSAPPVVSFTAGVRGWAWRRACGCLWAC